MSGDGLNSFMIHSRFSYRTSYRVQIQYIEIQSVYSVSSEIEMTSREASPKIKHLFVIICLYEINSLVIITNIGSYHYL